MTQNKDALEALDKIITDLTDRRGLRHVWDDLDEDIQQEIKEEWYGIIRDALERPQVDVEGLKDIACTHACGCISKCCVSCAEICKAIDHLADQGYLSDRSAWQPIENAPHNELVLLYCPDQGCVSNKERIELDYAVQGYRNEVSSSISHHGWATHWMPLPKPPHADEIKKAEA
jgi:hypothetical protein